MTNTTKIFKSLKEDNLTDKTIKILKEYIIKKNLKEGDKLPTEQKLSEVFNVSRNVVREALKSLEVSGILYKIQGKGIFVDSFQGNIAVKNLFFGLKKININFKELIEIRKSFEITVLKLLIKKITDEQINVLQSIVNNMGNRKFEENIKFDLEFHNKLIDMLENDFIKRLGIIVVEFFRELSLDQLKKIREENNLEEKLLVRHQKILDALKERNLIKAVNAMENHFKKGYMPKNINNKIINNIG